MAETQRTVCGNLIILNWKEMSKPPKNLIVLVANNKNVNASISINNKNQRFA